MLFISPQRGGCSQVAQRAWAPKRQGPAQGGPIETQERRPDPAPWASPRWTGVCPVTSTGAQRPGKQGGLLLVLEGGRTVGVRTLPRGEAGSKGQAAESRAVGVSPAPVLPCVWRQRSLREDAPPHPDDPSRASSLPDSSGLIPAGRGRSRKERVWDSELGLSKREPRPPHPLHPPAQAASGPAHLWPWHLVPGLQTNQTNPSDIS